MVLQRAVLSSDFWDLLGFAKDYAMDKSYLFRLEN